MEEKAILLVKGERTVSNNIQSAAPCIGCVLLEYRL